MYLLCILSSSSTSCMDQLPHRLCIPRHAQPSLVGIRYRQRRRDPLSPSTASPVWHCASPIKSRSHIDALPADQAAITMHCRLHVHPHKFRAMPSINHCRCLRRPHQCPANRVSPRSQSQPHSHTAPRLSGDSPSHTGRLVHADVIGETQPRFAIPSSRIPHDGRSRIIATHPCAFARLVSGPPFASARSASHSSHHPFAFALGASHSSCSPLLSVSG